MDAGVFKTWTDTKLRCRPKMDTSCVGDRETFSHPLPAFPLVLQANEHGFFMSETTK